MEIRALLLVCVFLTLAGCGEDPLVEWSGSITEESEHFILSYDKDLYSGSRIDEVEKWWTEVQICTGIGVDLSAGRLIIEYTHFTVLPEGSNGYIVYSDRYIRIDEILITYERTHKHEMIHYVLYKINTPQSEQDSHASEWFDTCVF